MMNNFILAENLMNKIPRPAEFYFSAVQVLKFNKGQQKREVKI